MSTASELIQTAFDRLSQRPGFVERVNQRQLATLISDLIEGKNTGSFEAPTGLGKSLAALIPAIAHALVSGKRTVIATYTNVLAEQYWRNDLPLSLSLFDDAPTCQFLIGRQRYACLMSLDEHAPDLVDGFREAAELGIETEFRTFAKRDAGRIWPKIAAPPVCSGKFCPAYVDCFYYSARRKAETASLIVTNHSVVIQDALIAQATESDEAALLGRFDFLVLDEAHDFPQAATNGLEFELSNPRLNSLEAVSLRLERTLQPTAEKFGESTPWTEVCEDFRAKISSARQSLLAYSLTLGRPGILVATPAEVWDHPQVQANRTSDDTAGAREVAWQVSEACDALLASTEDRLARWKDDDAEASKGASDAVGAYQMYLREYAAGCLKLFEPPGVAVSYVGANGPDALLRQDVIDLALVLPDLVWGRTPWVTLSATLSLDGNFDHFERLTGAKPDFHDVLPSPFDFAHHAAIYMPKSGAVPDPTVARREGTEERYFRSLARELSHIIRTLQGRTLALFHSRREMEGVFAFLDLPPELPVLVQGRSGVATVGERFLRNVNASLFAVRSFWTGFDAPGETLSCVALVRVPFEVPVDPAQIARLAYLQSQGRDPFGEHTLPQAKMMMRQGAGRLIRRAEDKGIVALLDPRLRTKRYGESILANLPEGMSVYDDLADALGRINLEIEPAV